MSLRLRSTLSLFSHLSWLADRSTVSFRNLPSAVARAGNEIGLSAFKHFNVTLKLLNESMAMCIPVRELDAQAMEELDHWRQLRFFGQHS